MALVKMTIEWYENVLNGELAGHKEVSRDEKNVYLKKVKDKPKKAAKKKTAAKPKAKPKAKDDLDDMSIKDLKAELITHGVDLKFVGNDRGKLEHIIREKRKAKKPEPGGKNAAAKRGQRAALTGDQNVTVPKTAQNG